MIPAKQFKKVKQVITEYLEGKLGRVRRYTFSTATAAKRRFWFFKFKFFKFAWEYFIIFNF